MILFTFPTVSTFDGPDNRSTAPSKMRTFSKITLVFAAPWAKTAGDIAPAIAAAR
jgi:hypothetical protein